MKNKYEISVAIPGDIVCEVEKNFIILKKEDIVLKREIKFRKINLNVKENKIFLSCEKANKKDAAIVKANHAHLKNMINGLEKDFVYEMEICNVHFPMTVKTESEKVVISNFLGEKINRTAKIIEGVNVEVKGQKVTVSGKDIEKTGQTAANIEKAARVSKKDRRIFQDGIYITKKPSGEI
jgi:large subunit ribosomal protein L6